MMLRSKLTLFSFVLIISLMLAACENSTSPEVDWSGMLSNYGNNIILPAFEDMQTAANELETAAENFENNPTIEQLETLQSSLKEARLAWQDVGPFFQFGPAESILLRPSLNTYPTDTDKIDDNISSGDYTIGSINNQSAAGLPALGYLLHGVGDSNEEILTMYTSDTEAEERMAYLLDNVTFIKEQINTATSEWQASGGDYIGMFLSEDNAGTDVGSSLGMLINSYIQYYERFVRDGKIGIPAGIRSAGTPRPLAVEAYYGGYSVELATANLEQIEQIFTGGNAEGLDDNLEALGAEDLSDEIQTQLDEAQSALNQLNDPLSQQIENNNEPVLTSFQELQGLVSLLKADMTSVLGITITFQDTDGD